MSLRLYVRGPRLLYRTGPRAAPQIVPVSDAAWSDIPPAVGQPLAAVERALAAIGFGAPTRGASMQANVSSCFSLLEHRDGRALASAAVLLTTSGRQLTTVVFQSELADGTRVTTSNSAAKRRFPRRAGEDSISFPEVRDAAALHAVHALRVRTLSSGAPPRPVTRGPDPIADHRRETDEFHARMVAAGYYRPAGEGRHVLTRRGAAFATWRGLFPWAHLTDWREERRRQQWRRVAGAA